MMTSFNLVMELAEKLSIDPSEIVKCLEKQMENSKNAGKWVSMDFENK